MSHAKWENVHICQFVAGTISSTSNHFRCLSFFSTRPFYDTLVDAVWGRCKDAFGQAWGLCEGQTGPPPSHEDMEKDMEIGAKHGWKYTWAVEDMPTVHCYGAVREGPSSSPSSSLMLLLVVVMVMVVLVALFVIPFLILVCYDRTRMTEQEFQESFSSLIGQSLPLPSTFTSCPRRQMLPVPCSFV